MLATERAKWIGESSRGESCTEKFSTKRHLFLPGHFAFTQIAKSLIHGPTKRHSNVIFPFPQISRIWEVQYISKNMFINLEIFLIIFNRDVFSCILYTYTQCYILVVTSKNLCIFQHCHEFPKVIRHISLFVNLRFILDIQSNWLLKWSFDIQDIPWR